MPSNRVDGPSSDDFMDAMIRAAQQGGKSTGARVLAAAVAVYGFRKALKRGKRK
jgi:hypothetical protein